MKKALQKQEGFTLVELMIVVVIIGVLSAVAIPAFINYVQRSKTSEVGANLKALFTGAATYYTREFTSADGRTVASSCGVAAIEIDGITVGNQKYDPTVVYPGTPDAPTSYDALGFSPADPLYYLYNIPTAPAADCNNAPNTEGIYVFQAVGDVNNDATLELFTQNVSSAPDNNLKRDGAVIETTAAP